MTLKKRVGPRRLRVGVFHALRGVLLVAIRVKSEISSGYVFCHGLSLYHSTRNNLRSNNNSS